MCAAFSAIGFVDLRLMPTVVDCLDDALELLGRAVQGFPAEAVYDTVGHYVMANMFLSAVKDSTNGVAAQRRRVAAASQIGRTELLVGRARTDIEEEAPIPSSHVGRALPNPAPAWKTKVGSGMCRYAETKASMAWVPARPKRPIGRGWPKRGAA